MHLNNYKPENHKVSFFRLPAQILVYTADLETRMTPICKNVFWGHILHQ